MKKKWFDLEGIIVTFWLILLIGFIIFAIWGFCNIEKGWLIKALQ